jgi:hypothetical protein
MRAALAALLLASAPQTATLRGEVVDAATGKPVPCRLYLRSADGRWHHAASDGGSALPYRKERDASLEVHTTLSAHPFTAELPPGKVTIVAERGKECLTETVEVDLAAGAPKVTVRLRRWTDLAARGWYSGDTHVHRAPDELANLQAAEDLNVAFPLIYWVLDAFASPKREGKRAVKEDPEAAVVAHDATHVYWPRNTEYELFRVNAKTHTLGAFFLLNHREVPDLGVPPVRPPVGKARAEGALVELDKHNWPWSMMLVPVLGVDLFELANNHHWRTDFHFRQFGEREPAHWGIERDAKGLSEAGWTEFGFRNWYALLDCGYRLRPTAGSANGVHPVPLGFGRVYVKIDGDFTYAKWLEGLNAGRSFVTTGPLLLASFADGTVSGTAESAEPLSRIEIVANGELVKTVKPANAPRASGGFESPFREPVSLDGSGWVAVRCFQERRFAHTAPFFVDVPGKPLRPRKADVEYLASRVQSELDRNAAVLPDAALAEYREALAAYRAKLDGAR